MADHRNDSGGRAVPVDVTEALAGGEAPDVLGVVISKVPEGARLSAGTDEGGGAWRLSAAELDGLTITPPPGWQGPMPLAVRVTAVEPGDSATQPTTIAFGLSVPGFGPEPGPEPEPEPEPESAPDLPPAPAPPAGAPEESAGTAEGDAVPLEIDTGLLAAAGSETVGITVSGVPEGAALSAGVDNGDGTWTVAPEELEGLAIRLPPGADAFFILGIAAYAADGSIATGSIRVDTEDTPESPTTPEARPAAPAGTAPPPPAAEALSPAPAPGPPDGHPGAAPIAYWKLDESAPGVVADEMGRHHGHAGEAERDGDAFDAVATFDGTGDVIEVPDAADLNPGAGTLTVWFDAFASGRGVIAAKGAPGASESRFLLGVESGRLVFEMASAEGVHRAEGGRFGANEWNQATLTWGAAGMRVYLNGELVADVDHPGGLHAPGRPWLFGAAETDGRDIGDYFHGELDDIALYGRALTAAEVRDLCHLGVEGLMAGKTAADVDSGLDLDAVPAAPEGPETLATVEDRLDGGDAAAVEPPAGPPAPAIAPGDADDPALAEIDAPPPFAGDEGEPAAVEPPAAAAPPPTEIAGDDDAVDVSVLAGGNDDGWSEAVHLEDDDSGADAVNLADGDELSLEGGEKLEW